MFRLMESGISNPDLLNQAAPAQAREVLVSNLGALIRQERQKRGLTLAQTCERAHISSAFLSLVERGKAMPSLGSLAGIAEALGLPVSTFLQVGLNADAVTRDGQRAQFSIGSSTLRYERLSTIFPGQQIDAVMIHVPPGYRAETISHTGEEWIYIVAGEFHQTIDGTTIVLGPGDTCHFRGDSPHSYANRGKAPVKVIWVGTVPVFRNGDKPQGIHP
jgi:transcriptional regulator with XRE-family HTH domain